MSKPTITEFLEARIAQDEELASAALVGMHGKHEDAWDWGSYVLGADRDATPKQDEFITEFWPARVLAECAAKRSIVDLYELHRENRDARRSPRAREAEDEQAAQDRRTQEARTRVAEDALRTLASVYKDHPDYDPSWAPNA